MLDGLVQVVVGGAVPGRLLDPSLLLPQGHVQVQVQQGQLQLVLMED